MAAVESHFDLFELEPAFRLDLAALGERYRALARATHPDRFAAAPEGERREAMSRATRLNDAYQTLKAPAQRARYLLGLQGRDMPLEATIQDPEFLMQQLQWREELEELQDAADLSGIAAFKARLNAAQVELEDAFERVWQQPAQADEAERLVRRMQFLDKLGREVRALEERLDD